MSLTNYSLFFISALLESQVISQSFNLLDTLMTHAWKICTKNVLIKRTALKALVNIFRSIYHDLETNMIQKKIIIDLKSRPKIFLVTLQGHKDFLLVKSLTVVVK